MGPSAALTPAIWDKTIPYDGENFHLEYMDLEEFLMENGIPTSLDEDALKGIPEGDAGDAEQVKATPTAKTKAIKQASGSPVTLLPIQELDKCEEVVIITKNDSDITCEVIAGECKYRRFQLSVNSPECSFYKAENQMFLFQKGVDT